MVNVHVIFNAERSTSFQILIVSWEDTREHPIEQCMGTKIGMVHIISEVQKL